MCHVIHTKIWEMHSMGKEMLAKCCIGCDVVQPPIQCGRSNDCDQEYSCVNSFKFLWIPTF
jgi:hypothetical protein